MSDLAVVKAPTRSRSIPQKNLKVFNPAILQLLEYYLTQENDRPITDLFPYDIQNKNHSRLADGLKEYKMVLVAVQEAIQNYQNGDLSNLDALVGENACQIRAILLWTIVEVDLIDSKCTLQKVNILIEKIDFFLCTGQKNKLMTRAR